MQGVTVRLMSLKPVNMEVTLKSYILSIKKAVAEIDRNRAKETLQIASDALGFIKGRIIDTGKDADGNKFPGYSKAVVPKWMYYGRSRSQGAEKRLKDSPDWFVSYEEFREFNNLRTDHVELSFTGEMWRNMRPEIVSNVARRTVVQLNGGNQLTKNKVEWHSERYGEPILQLSKAERLKVEKANQKRVNKTLKKFGLDIFIVN